jgi:hypothetical protein
MRILLGTYQLDAWAGSETYLLTLAEQLQRLGHDTAISAQVLGGVADEAARRGIEVRAGARPGGDRPDAVVAQDAATSYELAAAFPDVPQLYVAHSEVHDLQTPPQLPDVVQVVVAMNGRVARWVGATAASPPLVRLHQPVDLDRFRPAGALPARARRALLLGNYLDGSRRDLMVQACAAVGIEAQQLGAHVGSATADAASAIAGAHIVIGQGRAILEAMACGRAAYVFDQRGAGGWVTGESYPGLAEDGFAGVTTPAALGAVDLRADLERYDPAMGAVNRGLLSAHHDARHHAVAIVGLLRDLAPSTPRPDVALREMSRLVLLQWMGWSREQALVRENALLREGRDRAEAEYDVLTAVHAETLGELERTRTIAELRDEELRNAERPHIAPDEGRDGVPALHRRIVARLRHSMAVRRGSSSSAPGRPPVGDGGVDQHEGESVGHAAGHIRADGASVPEATAFEH